MIKPKFQYRCHLVSIHIFNLERIISCTAHNTENVAFSILFHQPDHLIKSLIIIRYTIQRDIKAQIIYIKISLCITDCHNTGIFEIYIISDTVIIK